MNYICSFTGSKFQVGEQPTNHKQTLISLHPCLQVGLDQIQFIPHSFAKLATFLYYLHKRGLVAYKPLKAFSLVGLEDEANSLLIATLCHQMQTRLIPAIATTSSEKLAKAPKMRLSSSTLWEIEGYIESLTEWNKSREEMLQDAAADFAANRSKRLATAASNLQLSAALKKTVEWADYKLSIAAESYSMQASKVLKDSLAGKASLYDCRKIRELLLDFLPEEKVEDSIRKEALLQAIENKMAERLNSFGAATMLSAEDREASSLILSRYSFKATGLDKQDIPANIQALNSMVSNSAMKEPVASDYPSALAYSIAKAAYKASLLAQDATGE